MLFQADTLTNHGDLYFELSNGYNVGQELCLGSLKHFAPDMWHEYVSLWNNINYFYNRYSLDSRT